MQDRVLCDLLAELRRGGREAMQRLFPLVYDELHQLARRELRRRPAGQTLNTTALLHDTYLKLARRPQIEWQDRAHFFAVASTVMRALIIDELRRKASQKRGGGWVRTTLDVSAAGDNRKGVELLALDEALHRLAEMAPKLVDLVEMRFFGGLSHPEVAAAIGVSERTARREWSKARALLRRILREG